MIADRHTHAHRHTQTDTLITILRSAARGGLTRHSKRLCYCRESAMHPGQSPGLDPTQTRIGIQTIADRYLALSVDFLQSDTKIEIAFACKW